LAREALFNILSRTIGGSLFVDLFAGSGAVGIEALSRGADKVLFVERSGRCCGIIRDSLRLLGADGDAQILCADLSRESAAGMLADGVSSLRRGGADAVFADPPYDYPGLTELPFFLSRRNICAQNGVLIIEHRKKTAMPSNAGAFILHSEKKYGDSVLSFYRMNQAIKTDAVV
jgi:16S rRNA (guanine(966)-N(2))-methyltransferase RsmD